MYKALFRLCGIVLFVVIVFNIDLKAFISSAKDIKVSYVVVAVILLMLAMVYRALRWYYIIHLFGIRDTLLNTIHIYISSYLFSYSIPGRLGESIKILYYGRSGYPLSNAIYAFLVDKLFDLLILGCVFIPFYTFYFVYREVSVAILVFLLLVIMTFVLIKQFYFVDKIVTYLLIKMKVNRDFKSHSFNMTSKSIIFLIVITLIWYLMNFYIFNQLAMSINLNISIFYLALVLSASIIVTQIPISFAGIGTRDAVLIFFLSAVSISEEKAVVFSSLILVFGLIHVFVGFIFWMINPAVSRKCSKVRK